MRVFACDANPMPVLQLWPLLVLMLATPPGAEGAMTAGRIVAGASAEPAACDGRVSHPIAGHMRAIAARKGRPRGNVLAKGVFLVASESLSDPNFSQTVVLLLDYDHTGAGGLVINRPTNVSLSSLLPDEENLKGRDDMVYIGGPVGATQLFLLLRSTTLPQQAEKIVDGVYASTSLQTLRDIVAEKSSADTFQAYAGYAGWGPGQLDAELERGDWLVTPADSETVFDKATENIWPDLIRRNKGLWVRGDAAVAMRAIHASAALVD